MASPLSNPQGVACFNVGAGNILTGLDCQLDSRLIRLVLLRDDGKESGRDAGKIIGSSAESVGKFF